MLPVFTTLFTNFFCTHKIRNMFTYHTFIIKKDKTSWRFLFTIFRSLQFSKNTTFTFPFNSFFTIVAPTIITNMIPREALYGGRTNANKLLHVCKDDEKIRYYDFTSLYPFVQKKCRYPMDCE